MNPEAIAWIVGRIVAGSVGTLLIYASLFLYENQERDVQNILDGWWIAVNDRGAHAISRQVSFLKVAAQVTSTGFARLFGEGLFGPKAIAASICYSQGAGFAAMTILVATFPPRGRVDLGFVALGVFFLALGASGLLIEGTMAKLVWLGCVLIATVGWIPLVSIVAPPSAHPWTILGSAPEIDRNILTLGLPLSVASDFLFIALTRKMLFLTTRAQSFIKIAALGVGNLLLAVTLIVVPLELGSRDSDIFSPFFYVGLSNCLDAVVSLAWFAVAIVMLLHRIFWPLVARPIYALSRYRVFIQHKKMVFTAGVTLLGFAVPPIGHVVEKLLDSVHD